MLYVLLEHEQIMDWHYCRAKLNPMELRSVFSIYKDGMVVKRLAPQDMGDGIQDMADLNTLDGPLAVSLKNLFLMGLTSGHALTMAEPITL